jgi:ribose transport system ATP-binding protein
MVWAHPIQGIQPRLPAEEPMAERESVLKVEGISKSFGSSKVLDDVSIEVGRNQIVGIVGENGAGKTTLFNIISGIIRPDSGRVLLRGEPIAPANYHEASLLGISRVFQEQALIPNIAIYENLLLSHEALYARWGQLIDRQSMIETAERIVEAAGLDIDVRRRTGDYDFSKRQSIEIARACLVPQEVLGIEYPIVLLDEPTSALQKEEEEAFFQLVVRLREHGSLIFVSHRLTEVLSVSDVIYVLKDGRLVSTVDPAEADEHRLHGLMVGRERDADYYHEARQAKTAGEPVVFSTVGLSRAGEYKNVSLDVRAGEILGIGGLMESGKSEFGKGTTGIIPPDSGTAAIGGGEPAKPDFRKLMRDGLGYVPAERQAEGMIVPFTVAWNMSLASGQDIFSNAAGIWRNGLEAEVARRYIDQLAIKTASYAAPCSTLSGGNQQKVVLSKWLCREPKVLVLDNPTRGVDAGAKEEIYRLIRELTADGVGIILITDELLELIGLSNRIAIMRYGQVTRIVDAPPEAKPTERDLIGLMLGGQAKPAESPAAAATAKAGVRMGAGR